MGAWWSTSRISPYGTKPVLISAWNPLQIPKINPSRDFNKSIVASRTTGDLRIAAINLPDPSGSSPAENPPGIMSICERLMASAKACRDSANDSASPFLKTRISDSAPAWLNALAVSYSQLLPGKTGMITLGRATLTFGLWIKRVSKLKVSGSPAGSFALVGKIGSKTLSLIFNSSSIDTFTPGHEITGADWVFPKIR